MRVEAIAYGALAKYLPADSGRGRATVELGEGATIENLIQVLQLPASAATFVRVNDQQADPGRVLVEGDEVRFITPLGGG